MAKPVLLKFIGDSTSLDKTFSKTDKNLTGLGARMSKVSRGLASTGSSMTKHFTLPIIAGLGYAAHEAANEDQAMAKLSRTIVNNTTAGKANVSGVEKQITKWQNATGILDDKLRPAYASLISSTHSVRKSNDLMRISMDIAAAKGLDVEQVTKAIGKAYQGNVTGLSRLGLKTKDFTFDLVAIHAQQLKVKSSMLAAADAIRKHGKNSIEAQTATAKLATEQQKLQGMTEKGKASTLSFDQIMQNATKTFGGSASAAAHTTAGKLSILKAKFSDLVENVGRQVIPIVMKVVGFLGKLASKFSALPGPVRSLLVPFGLVLAAAGPLLFVFGKMIRIAGEVKENWKKMTDVASKGAGKFRSAASKLADVSKSTGSKLLSGAKSFGEWAVNAGKATAATVKNTAVTIGQKAATLASAAASKVAAAATWLLNAAMDANPITLIVIAIAAFVAALVLAYNKVGWFRDFINAAWQAIQVVAEAVWSGIATVVSTYISLVVGYIKLWIGVLTAIWNGAWAGIQFAVSAVWNGIVGAVRGGVSLVTGAIGGIVGFVAGIPDRVFSAAVGIGKAIIDGISAGLSVVGNLVSGIVNAIKSGINWVIDRINDAIPNSIGWGPISVDLPDNPIPRLVNGGVFTKPTLAVIGEAGAEAVVPLTRPGRAAQVMGEAGLLARKRQGGSLTRQSRNRGGGGLVIEGGLHLHGLNPNEVAHAASRELSWLSKTGGI